MTIREDKKSTHQAIDRQLWLNVHVLHEPTYEPPIAHTALAPYPIKIYREAIKQ